MSNSDDWLNWTDGELERRMFDAQPGSEYHERAKYILEKRRHEREMARNSTTSTQPSMTPRQGIDILGQILTQGWAIQENRPINTADIYRWKRTARAMLIDCFGSNSENVSDFEEASLGGSVTATEAKDQWDRINAEALERQLSLLRSCMDQLFYKQKIWMEQQPSPMTAGDFGKGIFLVHGHDGGLRDTVARFLDKLGLSVTILHEKPNKGRTLMEKFSDYSDVGFAVVLLTADDRGGLKDQPYEAQKFRARQNVLLELGFFFGKLDRSRVCALYEDGVEIPSDYSGVAFVPIDEAGAWRFQLAREIKEAGIPIDLSKVL